jgi:hypothetical protein
MDADRTPTDERAAFEAWANGAGYALSRHANGPYVWDATDLAWKVWQARAALSPTPKEDHE